MGEGINDGTLQLPVPDGLVDPGDILTDGLVVPTGHTDHAVDANVVESLEVLLAVHLDLQLHPDILVHGPRLLEVFARWGGPTSTVEERLRKLGIVGSQTRGEGGTESRDAGNGCGQGWDGQEVINEWNGAGLGNGLHPIDTVHRSGFVKCGHNGLEQLRIDDRCAKVGEELLVEDLSDPYRKFGLHGAEVECYTIVRRIKSVNVVRRMSIEKR